MDAVSLLWAQTSANYSLTTDGASATSYISLFSVLVKDLAYDKRVGIWGHDIDTDTWDFYACHFTGSVFGKAETWAAKVTARLDRFAVKYEIPDAVHWDNNLGYDYRLDPAAAARDSTKSLRSAVIAANVVVSGHRIEIGTLSVNVLVKNLAFAKQVGIVYTADDWLTVRTCIGAYDESPPPPSTASQVNAEVWTVHATVGVTHQQCKFAAFYHVAGNTYWDNNFGRNYSL